MAYQNYLIYICPKCGYVGKGHKDYILNALCYKCKTQPIITTTTDTQYCFMTAEEREKWMDFMREKYTLHSNIFDEELYKQILNEDFENNLEIELEKRKETENQKFQIKCPICNSTNLSKISTTKKAAKIVAFGIFGMGDNGKTWKCNNCGSKF